MRGSNLDGLRLRSRRFALAAGIAAALTFSVPAAAAASGHPGPHPSRVPHHHRAPEKLYFGHKVG